MYGSAAESTEYSSVDILNMVARAGQKEAKDPKGVALILTQAENVVSKSIILWFRRNLYSGYEKIKSNDI